MSNERMTFEEMVKKYPDQWLFIVDCEHSASTELISGIVAVHSPTRDVINEASAKYKGGAAIRYTGRMQDPLKCQLEITNLKVAMWKSCSE